jgi:putative oxidoreductase
MKFLFPLGRLLLAFNFIVAFPYHLTHEAVQDAAKQSVPLAGLLVPLSGVLALAGGLSVAIGYKARWGAWALVAFLVPVTLWMHAYSFRRAGLVLKESFYAGRGALDLSVWCWPRKYR